MPNTAVWTLRETLIVAVLGAVFGVLYLGWVQVWLILQAIFGAVTMDVVMGFWFIVSIIAAAIIRTDPAAVAKLMQGEQATLMFTSPPYAQQRDYGAAKEKVGNWDALMQGVFTAAPVTSDAQLLVNLGLVHRDSGWQPYWEGWVEWMCASGWRRFGWYVWDQGPGLPGDWNGRLAPSLEFIFHFNRAPRKPHKTVPSKHAGETLSGGGNWLPG